MKNLEKFLEFNGKRIAVLLADGTWWVAVKPICEALGVNYNRQFQNIKEDDILSGVFANQQTHDTSGRVQEMLCLPEKFIYGWVFSLRSDASGLVEYKKKCYEVLYDHFHGALTARLNTLSQRDGIAMRIIELEEKLEQSEEYQEIQKLKKLKTETTKTLNRLDVELKAGQLSMDFK